MGTEPGGGEGSGATATGVSTGCRNANALTML